MSTMQLSPFYRLYELPWSSTEVVERRFRRVLWVLLAVFLVFGVAIPLLPESERPKVRPPVSERIVNIVLEKKLPPPPPPPEVKTEKPPEPVKAEPKPQPTPTPAPRPPDARKRAEQSMAQIQDDLAALRELDMSAVEKASQTQTLTGAVSETTSSERSLLTSRVGRGSGGINTAGLSRGYGAGSGPLGDITTAKVNAPKALDGREEPRRTASGAPGRSREEVELVFDRNKGAIYALYSRALRENPELKGKVVLELTIAPTGEITACRILSSELNDPELERKLVARIKSFRFDAKSVAPVTTTKPIDFFPA